MLLLQVRLERKSAVNAQQRNSGSSWVIQMAPHHPRLWNH